jgi:transposase
VAEELTNPAELIEVLRAQNQQLRAENKLLKEKVDLLVRRIFGVKSEKLDPGQLELLLNQMGTDPGKAVASAQAEAAPLLEAVKAAPRPQERKPCPARRERWPEDLPVVEEILDPEEVKAHPHAFRCIGQEVSETLDYEPARFFRWRLIRRKYVERLELDQPPLIAPLPESLQQRCVAAPGLLAQLIVSKFCDHVPLYRQEQIYWTRHQVWLPRASQARWLGLCTEWLAPIYQQIKAELMGGDYLQVDETPIRYLEPGNGKALQGYLWVASQPGGDVVFEWHPSRAATCLQALIPPAFSGTLQCDGYAAYDRFASLRAQTGKGLTLAGCWAHVRRSFFEALEQAPQQAGWVLLQIGHLYTIERGLRQKRAGPRLRQATRASQSRMIYERLHRALTAWQSRGRILPQSSLGKAISYTLGQWASLAVYLQDGTIEIDNNLVENAIRPSAVGKKNWLFFGDAEAGQRGAILYTLVESCRRRGVEAYAYLRDVLSRLPQLTNWQIKDITPKAWAKSKTAARSKAA